MSLVGEAICQRTDILARACTALAEAQVSLNGVTFGESGHHIAFEVRDAWEERTVRILHETFFAAGKSRSLRLAAS